MLSLKKHIANLFEIENVEDEVAKTQLELALNLIFAQDKNAEVRVSIKGAIWFIQITDME